MLCQYHIDIMGEFLCCILLIIDDLHIYSREQQLKKSCVIIIIIVTGTAFVTNPLNNGWTFNREIHHSTFKGYTYSMHLNIINKSISTHV